MKTSNKSVTISASFWETVLKNKKGSKGKDQLSVEECTRLIAVAMKKDLAHLDNPSKQIETLCLLTDLLIQENENGQYNELIGFYGCVGRSLKQLLDLRAQEAAQSKEE